MYLTGYRIFHPEHILKEFSSILDFHPTILLKVILIKNMYFTIFSAPHMGSDLANFSEYKETAYNSNIIIDFIRVETLFRKTIPTVTVAVTIVKFGIIIHH